jgi:hypothetical protein
MPSLAFPRITRQFRRAKDLAQGAMNSSDPKLVPLRVYAPDLIPPIERYLNADQQIVRLSEVLPKEVKESNVALKQLAEYYDSILPIAVDKFNFSGEASGSYGTNDDFLKVSEDLEDALTLRKGEDWAAQLLGVYTPLLDSAAKEYAEAVGVRNDLQKAQNARDKAAGEARTPLVRFRRVVRAVYGSTSREYHSIKDPRGPSSDGEDDDDSSGTSDQAPVSKT